MAKASWPCPLPGQGRLKFVAVVQGRCWLLLPGAPSVVLEEGDVILLNNTSFAVASDPTAQPIDGMPFYELPG